MYCYQCLALILKVIHVIDDQKSSRWEAAGTLNLFILSTRSSGSRALMFLNTYMCRELLLARSLYIFLYHVTTASIGEQFSYACCSNVSKQAHLIADSEWGKALSMRPKTLSMLCGNAITGSNENCWVVWGTSRVLGVFSGTLSSGFQSTLWPRMLR